MTSIESARLSAETRREHILTAAAGVFGSRGYHGATTDLIAKAAGISQPYVVRLFGTKEALFLAVMESAKETVLAGFRSALSDAGPSADAAVLLEAFGTRYLMLARERGVHESLMQAFLLGADPVVGAAARAGYLEIWRFLREEAGLSPEQARDFLAHGMLINVLLGLDLPTRALDDAAAAELVDTTCGPDGAKLLRF